MKKGTTCFVLALVFLQSLFSQQKERVRWYNRPAQNWNEPLSIGNGRLGVMVFGRPGEELLQLNEQTLWTGGRCKLRTNSPVVVKGIKTGNSTVTLFNSTQYLTAFDTGAGKTYQLLGK